MSRFIVCIVCVLTFVRCNEQRLNEQISIDRPSAKKNDHVSTEIAQLRALINAKDYNKAELLKNELANSSNDQLAHEALKMWVIFIIDNPDIVANATKGKRETENKRREENIRASLNTLDLLFKSGIPKYEMMSEIEYFKMWNVDINKGLLSSDESTRILAKKLEKKLAAHKNVRFPVLRKQFVKEADERLWEHNIDVIVSGGRNEVITFIGGIFANNSNIKETQSSMQEKLIALGFKRVNYKWYKYDDEYTYYELNQSH